MLLWRMLSSARRPAAEDAPAAALPVPVDDGRPATPPPPATAAHEPLRGRSLADGRDDSVECEEPGRAGEALVEVEDDDRSDGHRRELADAESEPCERR